MRKVLFLDRDGTINVDYGYVYQIEKFVLIDGILDVAKAAKEKGYDLVVVTNQSGIERGYYTLQDFQKITDHMCRLFKENGTPLLDVFYCPYLNSEDRKPKPGMFLKAAEKYQINMTESFAVGDKESDVLAAKAAGVGNAFLLTDYNSTETLSKITDIIPFLV